MRHLSRIIEQSREPMHHCLAESASAYAVGLIDILIQEALTAVAHPRRQVEVLFGQLAILAHLELL